MAIIDISPKISNKTAVFPGDTKFQLNRVMAFSSGDNLDLSAMTTTMHIGAHADAPSHYKAGGVTSEKLKLSAYLGPCEVIHVDQINGPRVMPADVPGLQQIKAKRVLFYTGSFPNPDHWNSDFRALSPELIYELHKLGVVLVGIDTPSVDPERSKLLESHQALAATDMRVLEGLILKHVTPGRYILIAPPLHLENAEAAPVRALLLSTDLNDLDS